MESFFEANAKQYAYWGNPEHKFDLITYEDTAKVVAAAVADANRTGDVMLIGESLNIQEITDIYNKVKGANAVPTRNGSLEDLKVKREEIKKADRTSFLAVLFGILSFLYDDRSKLEKSNNHEFPEVKFDTLEEFLVKNPDFKLP